MSTYSLTQSYERTCSNELKANKNSVSNCLNLNDCIFLLHACPNIRAHNYGYCIANRNYFNWCDNTNIY